MGSERLIAAKAAVAKQFPRVPLGEGKVSGPGTPTVRTLLGREVDIAATSSPKLTRMLLELQKAGWVTEYGTKGEGTYCHRTLKKIVLDPEELVTVEQILTGLVYEASYAIQKEESYISPAGLSRDEYVAANLGVKLRCEARRIMSFIAIRDDLETNLGLTILPPDVPLTEYEEIAVKYPREQDRQRALEVIASLLSDRKPQDAAITYREHYSKPFAEHYASLPPEEDSQLEQ